jgi:hypothetical protein
MAGVWLRFRIELRGRWRVWLGLVLLVGLTAGAVLGLVTGARRTDSAYDRFLASQHASDLYVGCLSPSERPPSTESCQVSELAGLPQVEEAALVTSFDPGSVEVVTEGGTPVQPDPDDCGYTGPGEISLVASPDDRLGTEVDRLKILEGRPLDPRRGDEVAVPVDLARRLDLRVGDTLRATLLAIPGADCNDPDAPRLPPRTLRVVGVEAAPMEIAPPSGYYSGTIHATPAFLTVIAAKDLVRPGAAALRLKDGVDPVVFKAELERRGAVIAGAQAEHAELVERAIRPSAVALGLVAALSALVAVAVLGQVLAHLTFLGSADHSKLRAVGMSGVQLVAIALTRAAAIAGGAAAVAVVVASLFSGLMPVGLARTVEPHPGVWLDARSLVFGVLATVVVVLLVVAWPAWRLSRTAAGADRRRPIRSSAMARGLRRAAFPMTAVTGVRMATEAGRGTTAVPVRSTLVGVTTGILTVVAALTFSASLAHLLTTPRLQGMNWDAALWYPCEETAEKCVPHDEAAVRSLLVGHPDIEDFATGTLFFRPFAREDHALELGSGDVPVDLLTFGDGRGTIAPTVIRGRAPVAPGEILVGTKVLKELGLDVGDATDAMARSEDGLEERSRRLTIVGTGVVLTPAGQLGRGAAMTLDGVREFDRGAAPEVVWLRLRPGADPRQVVADLIESAGGPESPDEVLLDAEPAEGILHVEQVQWLPLVLAGLMACLAAATLAYLLVSAVRTRRRDFATLEALGFGPAQVRMTVLWQATTVVTLALLLALPLGAGVGQWAFRVLANALGVLPEPVVPWWTLALVGALSILFANALASVPAWLAARSTPAIVLRSE